MQLRQQPPPLAEGQPLEQAQHRIVRRCCERSVRIDSGLRVRDGSAHSRVLLRVALRLVERMRQSRSDFRQSVEAREDNMRTSEKRELSKVAWKTRCAKSQPSNTDRKTSSVLNLEGNPRSIGSSPPCSTTARLHS